MRAIFEPVCVAIPAAIGTSATTVPTLVPILIEMKQAARNNPGKIKFDGNTLNARLTVVSILPIAFAEAANAPARTYIQSIRRRSEAPAPLL